MLSRFAFLLPQCAAALPVILTFSVYCVAASEPASVVESALELIDPLESDWALGDLDGDHKADVVLSEYIGHRNGDYLYRIELKLSRREGGSGSFSIPNTDALGLNIIARDVDNDHDLDLVITGRLSGQRIGVWVNDGGGFFTQDFLKLNSEQRDSALDSLRFNLPRQAIDESVSRRLPPCFPHARFMRAVLFSSSQAECSRALQRKFRFDKGPQHLRAPPCLPRS